MKIKLLYSSERYAVKNNNARISNRLCGGKLETDIL